MKHHKLFIFFIIFLINSFCYSQSKETILGFTLGETKDLINQKLEDEKYILKGVDNSKEIYPISLELYSKPDLLYNSIPVEHITFSYCFNELFCISIVTAPIDDLELLTTSRKIIKEAHNLERRNYIDIDEEFYDKTSNPAFYSGLDNQDFILVIYGKEDYNLKIPQCYNFMYKSKAEESLDLRKSYQKYSFINNYTDFSLDELEQKSISMKQEEENRLKIERELEKQKRDEEQQKRKEEQQKRDEENRKKQEEYNKKHRFDKFMGGITGVYMGGGFYNGDIIGGYGQFDVSLKMKGPFSIGFDWRCLGGFKSDIDSIDTHFRMDIDAYLSLGFALPFSEEFTPILFTAVAPGAFLCSVENETKDIAKISEENHDTFFDLRIGFVYELPFEWPFNGDIKFVYSREFTKNHGTTNVFSFLWGGKL